MEEGLPSLVPPPCSNCPFHAPCRLEHRGLAPTSGRTGNPYTMGMEKILVLCAAGLIAGESALLLVGMTYPYIAPWSTIKNIVLAATDIVLGLLLGGLAILGGSHTLAWLFCGAVGVLLVTHSIREVEYLSGSGRRFAVTLGLFVFNNVRLGLLAASLGVFLGAPS